MLVAKTATIFFFFCAAASLYGQQNDYAEHFIELKIDGTELSIDREFEIEVIIKREAPYLQKNNGNTPRFILEQSADTAELIQSSAIPERDGLHLRYRYRFNKTGRFRFEPELQWKRQTVELTPLDITVHRSRLSEHTPFVWTLYSASGLALAGQATGQPPVAVRMPVGDQAGNVLQVAVGQRLGAGVGRGLLDPPGPVPGGLDEGVLDGVVDAGAEDVLEEVLALGGVGAQEPGELALRQDDRLRELLPA